MNKSSMLLIGLYIEKLIFIIFVLVSAVRTISSYGMNYFITDSAMMHYFANYLVMGIILLNCPIEIRVE